MKISGTVIYHNIISVKFEGQDHGSEFTVTGATFFYHLTVNEIRPQVMVVY